MDLKGKIRSGDPQRIYIFTSPIINTLNDMALFEATNITKQFGSTVALDKVSISVPEQCIFGLLGPNGAGKTTLIRIINQITGPDSGELFLKGKKLKPEDVLSKGMQQKVQFITTVLHEPKLLIFDEPFTGFDPVNTNLIKNEILFLRERGATIIFSTHHMASVEELCDNITLIDKARTILEGSVDTIRKEWAANEYDLVFEGDVTVKGNGQYNILNRQTDNDKSI